jgi:lipopolysaccharide transport system ATP-binding protein
MSAGAAAGEARAEVEVAGVNLNFPLYHGSTRSLKKTVFSTVSGRVSADARNRVVVQALRDISFRLNRGDRLGLVGHNGAGKTTLLRALAGIYEPDTGSVIVRGSLNALLDPNLGMNLDLTGRENIALRGYYARLPKTAIAELAEDVASFAELGDFLDLPMRTYSSGMVVRLGFALATAIHPQVLLMDEWFLAGDAAFMDKARARLENLVQGVDILVLSTHAPAVVEEWCTRVIWLDQGRIREDGEPKTVLAHYLGKEL